MTAFSKNLTNAVRVFGGGPASLWNAYNWNAFNWGEGTVDIPHRITKFLINTQPADTANYFRVVHLITNSQQVDDSYPKTPAHLVGSTITVEVGPSRETLMDGSGYEYIFTSNESNLEDRDTAVWVSATVDPDSWSTATIGTTTWS